MENYHSKVRYVVTPSWMFLSKPPSFSPLRLTWIYQPSWCSEFLCSCQRTAGSIKSPCRCLVQTRFSRGCCRRHWVERYRKDGVWCRWSQGTFDPSGIGICSCTRFVFRYQAIFLFHAESLFYRCWPYVFLWRFCCTVGALRPRYRPHYLPRSLRWDNCSRLHKRGIGCAEEEEGWEVLRPRCKFCSLKLTCCSVCWSALEQKDRPNLCASRGWDQTSIRRASPTEEKRFQNRQFVIRKSRY